MQANAGSTADYDNSPQRHRGHEERELKSADYTDFADFGLRSGKARVKADRFTDVIPFALPRDPSPNQNLCNLRNLWMIICSFVSSVSLW